MAGQQLHGLQLETTIEVSASLQRQIDYWERYVGEWNAMVPTHLRYNPNFTVRQYIRGEAEYRSADKRFMIPELAYLRSCNLSTLPHRAFVHFGGGHGSDSEYIPQALFLGVPVVMYDISKTAMDRAAKRIQKSYGPYILDGTAKKFPKPKDLIEFGDIDAISQNSAFDANHVVGCKAGRLLQHFEKPKFERILRNLAKIVTQRGRRIILIHPCAEDELNLHYQYKTSYPYTREDILRPIREVAGSNVGIINEAHLWYYEYQYYTWMSIGQL